MNHELITRGFALSSGDGQNLSIATALPAFCISRFSTSSHPESGRALYRCGEMRATVGKRINSFFNSPLNHTPGVCALTALPSRSPSQQHPHQPYGRLHGSRNANLHPSQWADQLNNHIHVVTRHHHLNVLLGNSQRPLHPLYGSKTADDIL